LKIFILSSLKSVKQSSLKAPDHYYQSLSIVVRVKIVAKHALGQSITACQSLWLD